MAEGELGAIFKGLAEDAEQAVKRIADKIATFAEDGAARAKAGVEDVTESDRGAHDRINLAGRRPDDRLRSALDDRARSAYSDEELDDLLAYGRGRGLTPEETADFATAGAIAKPVSAKYPLGRDRIPPDDLKRQMDNWAGEVRPRGYPYHFRSAEQFHEFGGRINDLGEAYGLPRGRTLVQGSSLRTPDAKDIDIALIVSDKEFDDYAARCADGIVARARPRNQAGLLNDLDSHTAKGFIPQYMFDRPSGATQTFPQLSRELVEEYGIPDMDFSVMKESSVMALHPHLDLTRSTHE
jgi:hypothetical protein